MLGVKKFTYMSAYCWHIFGILSAYWNIGSIYCWHIGQHIVRSAYCRHIGIELWYYVELSNIVDVLSAKGNTNYLETGFEQNCIKGSPCSVTFLEAALSLARLGTFYLTCSSKFCYFSALFIMTSLHTPSLWCSSSKFNGPHLLIAGIR